MKSLGAAGLSPVIPLPAIASPVAAAMPAAAPAFSAHTYQWAEMIVRAHNKCNLGLLQRSLRVDETAAIALKESLIKNGVISAAPNSFGIHKATKPLYEGAFLKSPDAPQVLTDAAEKVDKLIDDQSEQANEIAQTAQEQSAQSEPENESENNDLDDFPESELQAVDSEDEEETVTQDMADEESTPSGQQPIANSQ